MRDITRLLAALLALSLSACATLSPQEAERAVAIAEAARSTELSCDAADHCAQPSPLHHLAGRAFAESTPAQPRHYALILDVGKAALLNRRPGDDSHRNRHVLKVLLASSRRDDDFLERA